MQLSGGMKNMAKKSKLRDAAIEIGSAIGKVDGAANKAARDAARMTSPTSREFQKTIWIPKENRIRQADLIPVNPSFQRF
jgi:hypothetical protein